MRKGKQLLLDEIKDKIGSSSGFFVTRYEKLEPNAAWQLRSALGKQGSVLEVLRKRIFLKALEGTGIQVDESTLEGHIGVVFFGENDPMVSAKTILNFSESNENVIKMLCGQVEGKMMPGAEVEMISKLPSLNEMRAIMLGLFMTLPAQVLSVMEAKIASVETSES